MIAPRFPSNLYPGVTGFGRSIAGAGILCYIAHTVLQSQRAEAYCQRLADQRAAAPAESQREPERPPLLTWNLPRSDGEMAYLARHNPKAYAFILRAKAKESCPPSDPLPPSRSQSPPPPVTSHHGVHRVRWNPKEIGHDDQNGAAHQPPTGSEPDQ